MSEDKAQKAKEGLKQFNEAVREMGEEAAEKVEKMIEEKGIKARLRDFERRLMDEMSQEPPEISRRVNENIWDLFHDSDEAELSVTVEWSEEDEAWMALEHNRDASAFANSPSNALRELATAIELYDE